MSAAARIGILGGTFDPMHFGHLDTALAAREALGLERVVFIPSRVPPHRSHQPSASPFHRFAMAALAVNGVDGLSVSDIELTTPGPSYTADTLARMREALGLQASQVFFITGADAFADIETWSRFPEVMDLAHFIVVSRPGVSVATLRQRLPALKDRMRLPLHRTASGTAEGKTSIFLVDAPTTDASSTEIRRRLRAALPVQGLVPAAIEHHIQQHGLYVQQPLTPSAADHLHDQDWRE